MAKYLEKELHFLRAFEFTSEAKNNVLCGDHFRLSVRTLVTWYYQPTVFFRFFMKFCIGV
jgi:hypothetical protein